MEPHRPDKGQCQILRGCLVRLEYLPSPTTHGVAARASEMPDLRPAHQTDQRLCCARVELKRVCGGRCAHGRAHGGLKSVEPREDVLSVLVGRRCCIAVGLDRERCGEIRIVKLGNASIINVRCLYLLVGCTRDGPA